MTNELVISAQYNGGKVLAEVKNKMQADYSADKKGALKEFEQWIIIKKQFDVPKFPAFRHYDTRAYVI